jgi:hypothetical protein
MTMRIKVFAGFLMTVLALSGCSLPPDAKDIDPNAKLVAKIMPNGAQCEITTLDGHNACAEDHQHGSSGNNPLKTMSALAVGTTGIVMAGNGNAAAGVGVLQAAAHMATSLPAQQTTIDRKCYWNGRNYADRESVHFKSAEEGDDFWARSGLTYGKTFAQRGGGRLPSSTKLQTCQCGAGDDGGWGCI